MVPGSFQSLPLPTTALAGQISAVVIDPGEQPADVINHDTVLTVRIEWGVTGFLVPLLAGTWILRVSVDEIGGSHDFTAQSPPVPLSGGSDYRQDIALPLLQAGRTYALIASLSCLNPAGAPAAIGGYVNVGTVNVLP
ncbi:hypothetical protein ACIBCM_07160 [Streptomyces sp. NPDC051018]|uniref:hypothetical protein n=1 Tax=Streptomyces sp. NPDC051018 TaxID=3365639 RepID=UPI0037B4BFE3